MRTATYTRRHRGSHVLCITPDPPSWVVLNERGADVLERCAGRTPDAVADELAELWDDRTRRTRRAVVRTIGALRAAGFVDPPVVPAEYPGRDTIVAPGRLHEIWLYTNRRCNLSCSHCFLGDWDRRETPLSTDAIRQVLADARSLGVERVHFTGGEPLLRRDLPELVGYVTETLACELVILTNGTALRGSVADALAEVASPRLTLQVTIDGHDAASHDAIRGVGTFQRAVDGIRAAQAMGANTVVATTLTGANADTLHLLPERVASWGVRVMHVHWLYRDGRASDAEGAAHELDAASVAAGMRRLQEAAEAHGVTIDNAASFAGRVAGPAGCRTDLCHAALEVVSVDSDGQVYACAPATGVDAFRLGSLDEAPLETIWRHSSAARRIRGETVAASSECAACDVRFLCGGGCLYRRHLQQSGTGGAEETDELCEAYRSLLLDEMWRHVPASAPADEPPAVVAAMGPSTGVCEPTTRTVDFEAAPVATYRCACYLASEVAGDDGGRRTAWACFSDMAPRYDDWANGHLGSAYGAAISAQLAPVFAEASGARVLEVGCGTGNYLLPLAEVAASAAGVDASDAMLRVAWSKARQRGLEVRLEHAFAESLPFDDASFDIVYSINALEFVGDAGAAVAEMRRVLRPGGTMVVGVLNRHSSWGLAQRVRRPFEAPDAAYYQGRFFTRDELAALVEQATGVELVSLDGAVSFPPVDARWWVGMWTRTPLGRVGELLGHNVLIATARKAA